MMFLSGCQAKETVRFWFENFWQKASFKLYKSIFEGWSLERIGGRRTGRGGRLGVGWKKQSFASVTTSSSPQASPKASSPRQLQKLKQLLHHHRTQIAQPPSLSSSWWFSSWVFILYPSNTEVFLYSLTKFDGLGGWFHYWGLKFWVLSSINWLIFWGSLSKFLRDLIWVVALFMWRRAY